MSGLTWGKPYLLKGGVALYRRAMSYGNTRDTVEWLVEVDGKPVREFRLMREAVAWFRTLAG